MTETFVTDLTNKITEANSEITRHGINDQLPVDEACKLVAQQLTQEQAGKVATEILAQYQAALDKHNINGHMILSIIGAVFLGLSLALLLISWQLALVPLPLFLYLLWPRISPEAPSRHAGIRVWEKIRQLAGRSD